MSISYVRPAKNVAAARAASQAPAATSRARRDLGYWIDQYERLTVALDAAKVLNKDPWRKEKVDTRDLYNQRAAAAAQMARYGRLVLQES